MRGLVPRRWLAGLTARLRARAVPALALLGAILLGGCQGEVERVVERVTGRGNDEPAYGDTLIDSMLGNISGLIPNITSDNYSHEVGGLLYSGLVSYDRDLNVVGELAESWTLSPTAAASPSAAPRRHLARRPALHRGRRHLHPTGDG
jgi:ABC-type transport system substrate-binding protein